MTHKKKKVVKTKFFSSPVKIFISIVAVLLIILVPFSIYYGNQQSQLNSNAAASTTMALGQPTMQVATGAPISIPLTMNPGNNAVSLIQLVVTYDSSTVTPNSTTGFQPNTTAFPTVLDGPIYGTCNGNQCTMSISLSIGNDVTKAITTQTTVGTLNFTPVKDGTTQISVDPATQIFSIAAADQANENVLATTTPTVVTIGAGAPVSITSFPQATPTVTTPQGQTSPTISPTTDPNASVTQGQTSPTISGGISTPTPTGTTVCTTRDNDDDKGTEVDIKKAHADIDKIEATINQLVSQKGTAADKKKALEGLHASLDQVEHTLLKTGKINIASTSGQGGCVGSFDPNNPSATTNCTQNGGNDTSALATFLQGISDAIKKLFGGSTTPSPTPTP